MCVCLSHGSYWEPGYNPGICPDWESNQRLLGLQPVLNPLSYTSQGRKHLFKKSYVIFST